jgi:heat shock protein HtpX
MTKRIFLFVLVNLLVVTTMTIVLGLLGVGRYFPSGGLAGLALMCLGWGFVGSFISLALSRVMAKWMQGVQVIPADTNDSTLRDLVETVHELARKAGLPAMPEVGIYDSPELNAFATGPTKSRALVAVSTGLLQSMPSQQATAVLGHEITHVANGDMVTMALIQGVINAFVMFLARVLAFAISQAMRSRNDDRGGGWFVQYMLVMVFQSVLSLLGFLVVCWFSRRREFRADAGGARLAGRENMIGALRSLERFHDPEIAAAEAQRAQAFQAFKISGGVGNLFATHPPMEERIAALEKLPL